MKYRLICAAAVCAVLLTSCGKDTDAKATDFSAETVTEYVMQDGDTTVTGEVVSVVGNEITLSLGTVSQSSVQDKPEASVEDGENDKTVASDEMPQMPSDGEMPKMPSDGEMPQMPFGGDLPDMQEGEMNRGENKKGGRGNAASVEKTGETASYIIPVGMQVSGATGRSADYSAVTAGSAVKLTLNSDGDVVACEIL